MLTQNDIPQLAEAHAYDSDGDKIGSVGQVYLNAQTGEPEWVTVKTGLFGVKETFVPLQRASVSGDRLTVAVDKETVKDAPRVDTDGALSHADEDELYTYYGLQATGDTSRNDARRGETRRDDDRRDDTRRGDTGRHRGDDGAMTRSEQRLVAGAEAEDVGRARLRKHVVTEEQQVRVPVSREEVRLEREPVTEANRRDAYAGPDLTESEHEVTLRAERPVVSTETVPVERVRLNKETVHDEETVSGEVRKEQIDYDGPDNRRR